MVKLYPLRFKEILRNYGFGNRWIADVYEKVCLPENHTIAETWEVVDRKGESSVVQNGALVGKTLHELIETFGASLLGRDIVTRCGTRFPLLIKFLDASNVLGEQAHHSDSLAAQEGLDDPGKTEAWYMLKVRDGATIHCGHKPGVTEFDVRRALIEGGVRELMQEYTVHPGNGFLLYAGTMHYSKGGALFYEIMQNSDVYIELRQINPDLPEQEKVEKLNFLLQGVHLEEGFIPQITPVILQEGRNKRTFVFACEYFVLERLDINTDYTLECEGERFFVLSQIEGTSVIRWESGEDELLPGHTCLLPANLGSVMIEPGSQCAILKSYVPDLLENVITPCRKAGIPDEQIRDLGGNTKLNPLRRLM